MSSSRSPRLLALPAVGLCLLACGGGNANESHIKPIIADIVVAPVVGSPPLVYFEKAGARDDIVTLNVRLNTTTTQTFDHINLEFRYDPTRIQVGGDLAVNPGILGDCTGGTNCSPVCLINAADANLDGHLLIAISRTEASCPSASVSSDTILLTLGFIAPSTIDPPGSPITLVQDPNPLVTGDCAILVNGAGGLVDLNIPCEGTALMTAVR